MAIKLQHLRSSVAGKAPQAADLDVGQIAVNFNDSDPALYIKDSAGSVVRIAGGGAAGGLWTRSGTELSPNTAGDSVFTSGDVKVGNTTAAPNISLNADGSATFAGTVIAGEDPTAGVGVGVSIASGGYYQACRSSGLIFRGYTQGNTTATSQLNADGSATFAGTVSKNTFDNTSNSGYGWRLSNGGDFGQIDIDCASTSSDSSRVFGIYKGTSLNVSMFPNGSASFAGDMKIGGTLPSSPNISGKIARIIGTEPRRPTQATKLASRALKPNSFMTGNTAIGRATKISTAAITSPSSHTSSRDTGFISSPNTTNITIWLSQASPS